MGEEAVSDGSATEVLDILIQAEHHGERLDRALALVLADFSRSHVQQLIEQGDVTDARSTSRLKPAHRVTAGQRFRVVLRPTQESRAYTPQEMPITSVFCDEHLRVIDKPAGLVVHPAPGNWSGTLLNGLLALDSQSGILPRAGIVHRLDKDTSGLMMVARDRPTMDALVQAIAARTVKREYLALVKGLWPHSTTVTLDGPIGRDPSNRLRMAVLGAQHLAAKPAKTHVRCLEQVGGCALLHCRLETGRTHQIRVHLSHHGHPLVGDGMYGGQPVMGMHRQALHAWRLALTHPVTGQAFAWERPPPGDFLGVCRQLGLGYNFDQ